MPPSYTLEKIKFATDPATFEKAVALYEGGKIANFKEGIGSYSATVLGTKPYRVSVEARNFTYGHCECYLGQRDYLCKHLVALAIHAVLGGQPIPTEDKEVTDIPICSGGLGELSKEELSQIKKSITSALRYIKAYEGPSRIWFNYQASLSEGVARLSAIISKLPVSLQTAKLLVELLLRLDKKLSRGGVDDSDGTVGSFIYETVEVLKEYYGREPECLKAFEKLCKQGTCFGWEDPLVEIFDNFRD